MKNAQRRARTLVEALPYLQAFNKQTVVIKYGGAAMVDANLKKSFAIDIALLKQVGINPVVVHGGGPQIGQVLKKIGKESQFIQGMRVTDSETMDVVEMVLAGLVNKEIVANINRAGIKAVGLSGKDGGLICAKKLELTHDAPELHAPEIIDLGHVGEVSKVDTDILNLLDSNHFVPIIAPIGYDAISDTSYNINADMAASAIAAAVGAAKVIFLTDVAGVLDADGELCSQLSLIETEAMIKSGIINGGMIPKVKCCMSAIEKNVPQAHIIDGRVPHAILLELFTDEGVGTVFENEDSNLRRDSQ
ncbi:MAG: acetylglutamate kinase [Mariprofundales bacterium]